MIPGTGENAYSTLEKWCDTTADHDESSRVGARVGGHGRQYRFVGSAIGWGGEEAGGHLQREWKGRLREGHGDVKGWRRYAGCRHCGREYCRTRSQRYLG